MKYRKSNSKKFQNKITLGQKFENWTVIDAALVIPIEMKSKNTRCKVQCKCGKIEYRQVKHLLCGYSKGCVKCRKHGSGSTSTAWKGGKYVPQEIYTRFKWGAKSRNIPFKITLKYIDELFAKQNFKCALSGLELKFGIGSKTTASLDRIDSRIGYIKGNVQWVHKKVNIAKSNFLQLEFINLCKLISKNS